MKPEFVPFHVCTWCGATGVALKLGSPNNETITWCEAGHVTVSHRNLTSSKLVYDFQKEEY